MKIKCDFCGKVVKFSKQYKGANILVFNEPTNFWIGLQYDGSAFKWQDNYPVR